MGQITAIPGFAEPFSAITHLLGAGVFLALAWPLVRRGAGRTSRTISLAIFAASCVLLLSMSGVYHLLGPGEGRDVLQRLDHAAIFVLIAGTFTPIHVIVFRGVWRWGMLAFVWCAAITGLVLKTIFFEDFPFWLGVVIYLALGWVGLFSGLRMMRSFGPRFIATLAYGAIAYTLGAGVIGLLALLGSPMVIPGVIGRHEIFHLCVLAGVSFHWAFVHRVADGSHCYVASRLNMNGRAPAFRDRVV